MKPARTCCGCAPTGRHKDTCSKADPKRRAAHEALSATKKQRKEYLISEAKSRHMAAKPARVQPTYRVVGPAPRNGETTAERSARIRAEAGDRHETQPTTETRKIFGGRRSFTLGGYFSPSLCGLAVLFLGGGATTKKR